MMDRRHHGPEALRPWAAAVLVTLALAGPVAAQQLPDPGNSEFVLLTEVPWNLLNTPAGTGTPLWQADLRGGGTVDATIHVFLRDATNLPIAGFPAEDICLAVLPAVEDGVRPCPDSFFGAGAYALVFADTDTDRDGHATISGALRAGGWSRFAQNNLVIAVRGLDAHFLLTDAQIGMNSPDIDGNGTINLSDVVLYSYDRNDPIRRYRSDFNHDLKVDDQDTAIMRDYLGTGCSSSGPAPAGGAATPR
jgi:hypothetical protein